MYTVEVVTKSMDTKIWHLTKMFQRRRKCSSQKLNVSQFLQCFSEIETGRQKSQQQHLSIHPSSDYVVVSKWVGSMCFVFFMFTASNQNPPRRQFSSFYPQIRATFNEFMKHAHTPAGGNGAHLSLSAPAIRKTDASQNSCGTLVDGKALHGLGSWGDSWARHKQI